MISTPFSRRSMLKGSAALMAAGATGALTSLHARQMEAAASGDPSRLAPVTSRYGVPVPTNDLSTGLPLLMLPPGFRYHSFGWSGDMMDDGQPVPDRHDGMAVVLPKRLGFGVFGGLFDQFIDSIPLVLIRNHERGLTTPFNASATYDAGDITIGSTTGKAGGGTTNLWVRGGRLMRQEASLAGTAVNCAGGLTPWGTWLTCEEIKTDVISSEGKKHGYVFEVHPKAAFTRAEPIVAMGRFSHEAVAIDPRTGYVYLTEDDRNKSGLYRFIPSNPHGRYGSLHYGGRLQAARVKGQPNVDLIVANMGDEYQIEWVDIVDPDADTAQIIGLPDVSATDRVSGCFAQAWGQGALRMSRGEGIWYSRGQMFIVDTSTGVDETGRRGRGDGSVWTLDLRSMRLKAIFVSGNSLAANNPDNVTVSPRGGVLLCEDGGNSEDTLGPGARLVGLTRRGESFYFAKNNITLDAAQVAAAGKNIAPDDYRDSEFCGACWDPFGRWLFVNAQSPGITFAITGPWLRGEL
jgi:uncharacterized protein